MSEINDPPIDVSRRRMLGQAGIGTGLAVTGMLGCAGPSAPQVVVRSSADATEATEFLCAHQVAQMIRERKVSSLELTRHQFARIKRLDPAVNAVVTLDEEGALQRAAQADHALARGEAWGPLHGVPVTIKDTLEVAGMRTTAGAPALARHVPRADAASVAGYRRGGAVILGKMNVPIYATGWQTGNELFSITNNPWDPTLTPGGSSGGSPCALAMGFAFLELGSDLGGSIRIPTHFCGVVGHRPSAVIVPLNGHIPPRPGEVPPLYWQLPSVGPLGRCVADVRLGLELAAGPHPDDATAWKLALPPARKRRLSEYRIGYVLDDRDFPVDPAIKELLAATVEALRKEGARLLEGWPEGFNPKEAHETFVFLADGLYASAVTGSELDSYRRFPEPQDGSYRALQAAAFLSPHRVFLDYEDRRTGYRQSWKRYFSRVDAFLIPPCYIQAFKHDPNIFKLNRFERAGYLQDTSHAGKRPHLDIRYWIASSTLIGLPATVVPVDIARTGLPVGAQVIGPYLEDATSLQVAEPIEQPWVTGTGRGWPDAGNGVRLQSAS